MLIFRYPHSAPLIDRRRANVGSQVEGVVAVGTVVGAFVVVPVPLEPEPLVAEPLEFVEPAPDPLEPAPDLLEPAPPLGAC